MTENYYKLREKAIAAYEASSLKENDTKKNKEAAHRIQQFLSKFEIDVQVDSNVIEIDNIRFYAFPCEDIEGMIYAYRVRASRDCPRCRENIVMEVADYEFDKFRPETFGQWLLEPHFCEFEVTNDEKKRIGFKP